MDGFYFSTIVSKAEDTEIVFITLVMMIDYALHVRMVAAVEPKFN